ncbi:Glycosyltransferase involved in cell wall bisynthesis [Ruminococcaceae bacterium FB2012]|nr:Glycosyltransferase involved in cell wall bisynthesis [Ruminococcaceae bacterium FB2012]
MVSIIIPVYNVEKYLCECIDSVLRQSFSDLEIILVDDGSPDNSGAICDEYARKDSRVTVIHKCNGGLSDARNVGMAASHGEYIYFLDSDDYIVDDAIWQLESKARTENADIVFFDSDNFVEDFEFPDYIENFSRTHSYRTERGSLLLGATVRRNEYCPCVPFLFFKRDFLAENGLVFYKGIIHEDELFTPIAFARAKTVAYINKKLYVRRLRGNSIMSAKASAKSFEGSAVVMKELDNELGRYPVHSHEYRAITLCMGLKCIDLLLNYALLDSAERKRLRLQYAAIEVIIKKHHYFGSEKLRLKTKHPVLYSFFKQQIRPISKKN